MATNKVKRAKHSGAPTKGGVSAYQGFDYQIRATVWLALDLVLRREACAFISVEPASGEDVKADLKVEPEAASSNVSLCVACPVEIQIKFRQNSHWTSSRFMKLLEGEDSPKGTRGPSRRVSPLGLLRTKPNEHFLLLTNAPVETALQNFVVQEVGQESGAATLAGASRKTTPIEVLSRIAILCNLVPRLLDRDISEVLRLHAHVPSSSCSECATALMDCVRQRLLGRMPSKWAREELLAKIRQFDGFPKFDEQLIVPDNYDVLRRRLAEEHKLVITGPSGTGKSTIARKLAFDHQVENDPFRVVCPSTISEIDRLLAQEGRFLFLIEDPWGKYKLAQESDLWASELPKLFNRASSAKRFLVASREGIRQQALPHGRSSGMDAAQITLLETDYSKEKRKQILQLHLQNCAPWQRDLGIVHEREILRELHNPLCIKTFATLLSQARSENEAKIPEIISKCNVEAVVHTVAEEIAARGKEFVAGAIAIWALTMTLAKVDGRAIRDAQRCIKSSGYLGDLDLPKLAKWLGDSKWISLRGDELNVHSTILQGMESLFETENACANEVLIALLRGSIQNGKPDVALNILKKLHGRNLAVPQAIQLAINSYLVETVTNSKGFAFREAFFQTADYSYGQDPVSLLIRSLGANRRLRRNWEPEPWSRPTLENEDIEKIRNSAAAKDCAKLFIEEVLAEDYPSRYSARTLFPFFQCFGWDLAESFLKAAKTALGSRNTNCDIRVLIEGALTTPAPAYNEILDAAISAHDKVKSRFSGFEENYREAEQAECDAEYATHVMEEPGEAYYLPDTALKTIVRLRRENEGFLWVLQHPRREVLLEAWASTIDPETEAAEIRALVDACQPSALDLACRTMSSANQKEFIPVLVQALGGAPLDGLEECLAALGHLTSLPEWETQVVPAVQGMPFPRRAVVAMEALQIRLAPQFDQKCERMLELAFTEDERTAIITCQEIESTEKRTALNGTTLNVLHELARLPNDDLAARAVLALARHSQKVETLVARLITSTKPKVRACLLCLIGKSSAVEMRQHLVTGLEDIDYRCCREAILGLAPDATDKERALILQNATHRSAPVREALADVIGEFQWQEGQPILFELLSDRRNAAENSLFRGVPDFHVARAAARAFGRFETLSEAVVAKIIHFLENPGDETERQDPVVRYLLMNSVSYKKDIRLLPTFLKFLDDTWFMPGMKDTAFPLRYAAAWGVVQQLLMDIARVREVPPEMLFHGATHSDGRLAGPCLLALGLMGKTAYPQILVALRDGTMTSDRACIVSSGLCVVDAEMPPELLDELGKNHPFRNIVNFAQNDSNEDRWREFLLHNDPAAKWVEGLQSTEDVNPALRLSLSLIFGQKITTKLDFADLRDRDLPQQVPVLTMRSMFGGE